jgi:hypothetical protein
VPIIFNPLFFFRHVPNASLEQFFSSVPAFEGFDWSAVSERRVEPIHGRCKLMPPTECARVFDIFRMVESLANPLGTQALIEAARDIDIDVAAELALKKNAHERALWCYVRDKRIFQCARMLAHLDQLPKRSSETLKNLPVKAVDVTPDMLAELGRRFSEFFWTTQARGERCIVEHRRREGDVDCFFAYPADYLEERFGYGDDGQLELQRQRPAFEVVFGYHREDGTTNVYVEGGRKVRQPLAEIFARVVLGLDRLPEPLAADPFNLEIFKNANITFPTNPADRISLVRVQSMRLQFHGYRAGRITIAVDARSKQGSVYEVIADKLSEKHARLTEVTVLGVTMQAFLQDSNDRERSLSFKISAPATCDLDDSPEGQLLRRYLPTWGIEKHADDLATAA